MRDAVLHARISVGGTELMGADIPSAQPMRSAYLSLAVDSDAEAERVFSALSERGELFMPMQETFFATRFGQLRDRFGINWMVIRERPMNAPAWRPRQAPWSAELTRRVRKVSSRSTGRIMPRVCPGAVTSRPKAL
jgi:predicted 3-demethylubiquinone-9 3-methyltransferase (glyoxalase superfamily)